MRESLEEDQQPEVLVLKTRMHYSVGSRRLAPHGLRWERENFEEEQQSEVLVSKTRMYHFC